jgi:HlyD family secretion protein/adhesin transport system membrane fusion protein
VAEIAVTSGEIVPSGRVRPVQHLEGGIVAQILVSEGERVEVGQPLVRLDAAAAEAEQQRLRQRRDALRLECERLAAFAEDRAADWSGHATDPALLADQERLLAAEREARGTQLALIADQIAVRTSELRSARDAREVLEAQMRLLREELAIRKDLFRRELNSRLPVVSAQLQLGTAEAEAQRLDGSVESLVAQIGELEGRAEDARAQLRRDAYGRLAAARQELGEVEKTLAGMGDRLARLVVTSPARGLVQELRAKVPGAVLEPGGLVAEIVPSEERLLAEVRVTPRDIGFVKVGQPARVKVTAYDFTRFGVLEGRLVRVSASTFVDPQKNPYYAARIELRPDPMQDRGRDLLPGMVVQADITTGRKTVLEYLLKPIYAMAEGAFHER